MKTVKDFTLDDAIKARDRIANLKEKLSNEHVIAIMTDVENMLTAKIEELEAEQGE